MRGSPASSQLFARSPADWLVGCCLAGLAALPPLRAILAVPEWSYLVALAVLLAAASIKVTLGRAAHVPNAVAAFVCLAVLLYAWLMLSATWSVSTRQFTSDLILLIALLAATVSTALLATQRAARITLGIIAAVASLVSFAVFGQYIAAGALVGYNLRLLEYYLTISTLLALGAVVSFTRAAALPHRRWVWGFAGFTALAGLALSLGRGALLSAMFLIMVFGTIGILSNPMPRHALRPYLVGLSGRLLAGGLFAFTIAAGIWGAFQVERTRARLLRLFSGGELTAEGSRAGIWARGWERIAEAPVQGYGLGSSGLMSALNEGTHPHNLFLQVWLDGGVLALVLLAMIVAMPFLVVFYQARTIGMPRAALPLLAGYALLILEYSKSYSVYTARTLFIFGALVLVSAHRVQENARAPETGKLEAERDRV